MEIATSALANALRVGVQVVVAQRRLALEIYLQLCNRMRPEVEFNFPAVLGSSRSSSIKHRPQDIYVEFVPINIGSVRAENVSFLLGGTFKRPRGWGFGERFNTVVPQVPPAQSVFLLALSDHELNEYIPDGTGQRAAGFTKNKLTIDVHYDGPNTLLNRIARLVRRWRGLKQYRTRFVFDPQTLVGDLPPARYE